jgi:hypothetical protein
MTPRAPSPPPAIDTEELGLDRGAHLLVSRALRALEPGGRLVVRGRHPELGVHLRAWCRDAGHRVTRVDPIGGEHGEIVVEIVAGDTERRRWTGAVRAGNADWRRAGAVAERPPGRWGLAARGALVEAGAPELRFPLDHRVEVWADEAPRLYAQAVAAQWDPATAIDWEADFVLDAEIEQAVVQVMTYLVENENAALVVPARFLAQLHPHFREVMQLLAVQCADEARHVEVFTRRAVLRGGVPGSSTAGGQASLRTLVEEPDFATASFLLSVLGEGTFLSLLAFLVEHAPDSVTREACRLAHADEARHVAFGMAHLGRQMRLEPGLSARLAAAVARRHDALAHTAGLNAEVYEALVVLAAGALTPAAVGRGWDAVQALQADMDRGRRRRLAHLGFGAVEAAALSSLHTRNFM